MNTQISPLEEQKQKFAEAFIEAIASKSIEACKKLITSYEERVLMFSEAAIGTPEEYDKLLNTQCLRYFDEADSFIDAHKQEINTDNIGIVEIDNLGGEVEISEGCLFRKIPLFSIAMKAKKQENYRQSNIEFQIEGPFVINGKIRINNFTMIEQHEITGIDKQTINSEFSSPACSIETHEDLLARLPHLPQLESLQESSLIKVYENNTTFNQHLSLEDYDKDNYSPDGEGIFDAIFILGSLIVEGNIFNKLPNSGLTLYVEKDCQADNVTIGGSLIVVKDTLTIKNFCLSGKKGYLQAKKIICPISYGENIWCDNIEGTDGYELAEIEGINEKILSNMICNGDSTDEKTQLLLKDKS